MLFVELAYIYILYLVRVKRFNNIFIYPYYSLSPVIWGHPGKVSFIKSIYLHLFNNVHLQHKCFEKVTENSY